MDNDIIRAYIWDEVIKLGFSPTGDNGRKRWLREYGNSLENFWEVDGNPCRMTYENGQILFNISCHKQVCLDIELRLSGLAIHNTRFLYNPPKGQKELMWVHGVDLVNYFFFPERSLLNKYNKRNSALTKVTDYHIEAVVAGLICHPHTHQHIESPINEHEIRIGGGISNPFLFLFHLRYQFCPIKEKRERERGRLINLFSETFKNKKNKIELRILMAQPDRN